MTEWPRERRAAHGGCVFGSTLLIPLGSRDRTLLVGVSHDGIDRKPFAADQPCRNTRFHDMLEDTAENVTVTEPFIAGAREGRVIRDLVLN